MHELAPAARGSQDAGSRNLGFTFQPGTVSSFLSIRLHPGTNYEIIYQINEGKATFCYQSLITQIEVAPRKSFRLRLQHTVIVDI